MSNKKQPGRFCVVVREGRYEDCLRSVVYGPCTKKAGLDAVRTLGAERISYGVGDWISREVCSLLPFEQLTQTKEQNAPGN